MYSAGTSLYANKDGVFYYDTPDGSIVVRSDRQYSDPVRNMDGYLGTATGQTKSVNSKLWVEVDWVNSYVVHGLFGLNKGTYNEDKKSWVEAVNIKNATSAQEEKEAEAKAEEERKARLAALAAGTDSNPALTANGGSGTSSQTWIWWLVGAVLVSVAALVVWKIGKRPKAIPVASTPPTVQRPVKLK